MMAFFSFIILPYLTFIIFVHIIWAYTLDGYVSKDMNQEVLIHVIWYIQICCLR